MTIESRVRRIYERRPYPPPSQRDPKSRTLPPRDWIDAVRENASPFAPNRVLVAGCGVGTETFALARRFPKAEIVGVDFSKHSIAIARRLQKKRGRERAVQFAVADISGPGLLEVVSGRFDLVTCHGVLSYVPDIEAALDNFARLLTPSGVLLLGVNGAAHPSVRYRRVLPALGIDPTEFTGDRVLPALRVLDSLSNHGISIADLPAGYLAGDIFGPLNHSLSLDDWMRLFRRARLHLCGSLGAFFSIRSLVNRDLIANLMPRSRAEIAVLIDRLQPATFHQLVLSLRPPPRVPWGEPRMLRHWCPSLTTLYRIRWPRGAARRRNIYPVRLESPATNTAVALQIPAWEAGLLRGADGTTTFRSLLGRRSSITSLALREAMYLLYQLCVINVRPEA